MIEYAIPAEGLDEGRLDLIALRQVVVTRTHRLHCAFGSDGRQRRTP